MTQSSQAPKPSDAHTDASPAGFMRHQSEASEKIKNNPIVLSMEHVNFYYGREQILHDINLRFKRHAITALIGPSGSGKSTLLRVLNKIYAIYPGQKATGRVMYRERDILKASTDIGYVRTRIGMVFQKPTPFPMSIYDNIAFALRTHYKLSKEEVNERVERALRQSTLWDEVKDKLHEAGTHLSGGQQQRLCFARTIAIEPDVLLLDEPTSSLDPISSQKVQDLIERLKSDYSIVLVTHHLKQAQAIADDTIFMRSGRIVECGSTEALFRDPQEQATRDYIALGDGPNES